MKARRLFLICFLLLLTGLDLFAGFMHAEKGVEPEEDCLVCMWERNTISVTAGYVILILMVFVLLFRFQAQYIHLRVGGGENRIKSRAPPAFLLF